MQQDSPQVFPRDDAFNMDAINWEADDEDEKASGEPQPETVNKPAAGPAVFQYGQGAREANGMKAIDSYHLRRAHIDITSVDIGKGRAKIHWRYNATKSPKVFDVEFIDAHTGKRIVAKKGVETKEHGGGKGWVEIKLSILPSIGGGYTIEFINPKNHQEHYARSHKFTIHNKDLR